jgi:hypothetical protein
MIRRFMLLLPLIASLHGEAPKVTVIHTTEASCALGPTPLLCRQVVAVLIETEEKGGKYLVGIRYLTKDGVETIESRYPVESGGLQRFAVYFYIDDVRMLSATAGSLKTNEVGVWVGYDPRGSSGSN